MICIEKITYQHISTKRTIQTFEIVHGHLFILYISKYASIPRFKSEIQLWKFQPENTGFTNTKKQAVR